MKKFLIITVSLILVIIIGFGLYLYFTKDQTIELDGQTYVKIGSIDKHLVYKSKDKTCDNELEKIYEDDSYSYFFSCMLSEHYVVVQDDNLYNIKEALFYKLVSIDQVMNKIPNIIKTEHTDFDNPELKKPINFNTNDYQLIGDVGSYQLYVYKNVTIPNHEVINLDNIEIFYQDDTTEYYFNGYYSHYYVVVKDDDIAYLPYALKDNKISIDDLLPYEDTLHFYPF